MHAQGAVSRTRTPRGTLNPAAIVDAAISVLDSEPLESVTIKRLADRLGVRPMSLYTHFRDKDAILSAVSVELLSRIEIPRPTGNHFEQLKEMMRAYFRLLKQHPVLLQMNSLIDDTNTAELQFSEHVYACLNHLHVDQRTSVGLVASLLRFALGSALVYPIRKQWDDDPGHWQRVTAQWKQLPAQQYPAMRELKDDSAAFTQDEVFEFGLNALLAGIDSP